MSITLFVICIVELLYVPVSFFLCYNLFTHVGELIICFSRRKQKKNPAIDFHLLAVGRRFRETDFVFQLGSLLFSYRRKWQIISIRTHRSAGV